MMPSARQFSSGAVHGDRVGAHADLWGPVPGVVWAMLAVAVPSPLFACAVCFGQSDNAAIGRAYSVGIFILMGFTFLIMGALAVTAYRIEARRATEAPHGAARGSGCAERVHTAARQG